MQRLTFHEDKGMSYCMCVKLDTKGSPGTIVIGITATRNV